MSDWQLIENVPEGFFMRIGGGKWIIIKCDEAMKCEYQFPILSEWMGIPKSLDS